MDNSIPINGVDPFKDEFNPSNFLILSSLGSGGIGTVYKVVKKESGEIMACKKIPLPSKGIDRVQKTTLCSKESSMTIKAYYALEKEEGIMSPEYLGFYVTNKDYYLYLSVADSDAVTLNSLCGSTEYTSEHQNTIIKKLVRAVNALHSHDVYHMDLNMSNIMYSTTTTNLWIVDFGMSTTSKNTIGLHRGTPEFISPEMAMGYDFIISNSQDIWALGVCIFALSTKTYPHKITRNTGKKFKKDFNTAFPDKEFQYQGAVKMCFLHQEHRPTSLALDVLIN